MDAQTVFYILGMAVFVITGGMVIYPILQAYGVIPCNCDKASEQDYPVCARKVGKM